MTKKCDLSGKTVMTGNNVSHAKNRTKRRFLPNLCQVTLQSESLGRSVRLKVAANTLRTVDKLGGLDRFLLKAKDDKLSPKALKLKKDVLNASSAPDEKEASETAS